MSEQVLRTKKRPVGRLIGFGILTTALYAAVFTNSALVTKYFTMGGVYAALPIATAFLFSYVHGTFTGCLWSALGVDAKRTQLQQRMEEKAAQKRKAARPRLRLNA